MDNENTYYILFLTIIGFIIFLAFYILFLYIPTVEFENEFNTIADQADGILRDAIETSEQIEELNKTVEDGFIGFCSTYNSFFRGPFLKVYLGNTYVEMCNGIN